MSNPSSTVPIKTDLINTFIKNRKLKSYLEFCTTNTGFCYSKINRNDLKICQRLLYRCTAEFNDNLPIDFRSETNEVSAQIEEIKNNQVQYDIILCDPWHLYSTSLRDIETAFELLKPGGILIVHDCKPYSADIATPLPIPGSWCGVTYQAYLDFVLANGHKLKYYTVDIDYGCGVIIKRKKPLPKALFNFRKYFIETYLSFRNKDYRKYLKIIAEWKEISSSNKDTFPFFFRNSYPLLNLIPYEKFLNIETISEDNKPALS